MLACIVSCMGRWLELIRPSPLRCAETLSRARARVDVPSPLRCAETLSRARARVDVPSPRTAVRSISRASVDRGGCILRAPGGPVDLDRHPAGGGSRVDQFERGV